FMLACRHGSSATCWHGGAPAPSLFGLDLLGLMLPRSRNEATSIHCNDYQGEDMSDKYAPLGQASHGNSINDLSQPLASGSGWMKFVGIMFIIQGALTA